MCIGALAAFWSSCEPAPDLVARPAPGPVDLALASPVDADLGCAGSDRSPALSWTPRADAPFAAVVARSRVAGGAPPRLHWMAWDLPAAEGQLPAGIRSGQAPPIQGLSEQGAVGWAGPCDPPGTMLEMEIEIWLLDRALQAPPTLELQALQARAAPHLRGVGRLRIGPTPAISPP